MAVIVVSETGDVIPCADMDRDRDHLVMELRTELERRARIISVQEAQLKVLHKAVEALNEPAPPVTVRATVRCGDCHASLRREGLWWRCGNCRSLRVLFQVNGVPCLRCGSGTVQVGATLRCLSCGDSRSVQDFMEERHPLVDQLLGTEERAALPPVQSE